MGKKPPPKRPDPVRRKDPAPEPIEPPAEQWRRSLLYDWKRNTRVIVPCQANVTTILRHHEAWRGVLAFDEFGERIVTLKVPPWERDDMPMTPKAGPWSDEDSRRCLAWLARREKMHVGIGDVEGALAIAARADCRHPIRDYRAGLKWDGKPRLDRMLVDLFGCEDTPYTRGVGSRWMIGACARGLRPGCQMDTMLILNGKTGFGKSTGLRELVPDPALYSESGITIGDRDSYEHLRGLWVYLFDELESLSRADTAKALTFLTAVKDRFREAYGRRSRDFFRQTVFAGTTENSEVLKNEGGRRRYWVVDVVRPIDRAKIAAARDQLWAEAFVRYEKGEAWHANTPEFRRLCEDSQEEHTVSHPWEAKIARWLKSPRDSFNRPIDVKAGILTHDVLEHALQISPSDWRKPQEMDVARILLRLGYERTPQLWENGVRVRRYVRTAAKVVQVVQPKHEKPLYQNEPHYLTTTPPITTRREGIPRKG